jgi:uncharacterized membrane protein
MMMLAALHVGPVQFDMPVWLWLIPLLGGASVWMARKSLSGLGGVTRWVSLAVRLIVIALLAGAMAEPSWRKESKAVAVTMVLDTSESVPTAIQQEARKFMETAIQGKKPDDEVGLVTAAKNAYVQSLPSKLTTNLEPQHVGAVDGTNLADALKLAIATAPPDAGLRLLLATDGNQTVGDILQAATMAKAMKIPIDVLPIKYKYTNEVMIDRLVTPANAREGETMSVRVVLRSLRESRGRLTVLMNGQAVDLDPDSPSMGAEIELKPGLNVKQVQVTALRTGPQQFDAAYEAYGQDQDTLAENNRGSSVTFVSGPGKVLVITELGTRPKDSAEFLKAMEEAKVDVEVKTADQAPQTLTELNAYDAIVMINESAYAFSQALQEALRQYVHDTGGGLVMIGGPESYGAGGWIGSPLEDALPLRLDPPQKRQMPRGALALVIHSVEMPEGVFYGKKVSEAAVNSLSRLDLVGILEYTGFGARGGTEWLHKMSMVGDGSAVRRSIQNLRFGDMPDFTPSVEMAYEGLRGADAGQKHMIMISDGDPAPPSSALLDKFVEAKITISTVGVFPHGGVEVSKLKWIAEHTGGNYYFVNTEKALASIPEIFIKEAQTVRRSLIREQGGAGFPAIAVMGANEAMRGLSGVPNTHGYVVTGEREGLALVSLKIKADDPNAASVSDPLLATWQYGLGKVVAYTSDASTRWNPSWTAWNNYKQFWEQHVRWTMRPSGGGNVRITTENKGDQTLITVDALDSAGERLNFARFQGRIAVPGGEGASIDLKQVGPGRYQGTVATEQSGAYVLSLRYVAPDDKVEGGVLEGSAQAAITRPFADEYRSLEDNTPILTQVAEMTGGRVMSDWETNMPDLWSRDGVTMPVASRAIWLLFAVLGLTMFLADVGIRRVRIDIPAMWAGFMSMFGKSTSQGSEQLGSLMAAREQAKKKMAERAAAGVNEAQLAAGAKADVKAAMEASRRKFEASPEQLKKGSTQIALGGADARPEVLRDKPRPVDSSPGAKPQESEGMSRLLKAKQKARGEMEDDT